MTMPQVDSSIAAEFAAKVAATLDVSKPANMVEEDLQSPSGV